MFVEAEVVACGALMGRVRAMGDLEIEGPDACRGTNFSAKRELDYASLTAELFAALFISRMVFG